MRQKKYKKIFVTGAAGFIGSNLSRKLIEKGYNVIGLDNLSHGSLNNIEDILNNKNFKFVKGDIRNKKIIGRLMKDIDCVVHLAAYKIPRYGGAIDTLLVNSQGTMTALEAAKRSRAKFILASTSDVYGKSKNLPFCEDGDLTLGPTYIMRWAYAVSKLFNEHLCFAYYHEYGVRICILRFFGAYGINQNLTWWGGPQSLFITAAIKKEPMEIHGDGKQTRTFTYIDDTVDGITRAIENEKSAGQIFNIGNNEEISILDLARLVWKLVNKNEKPKIKFIPYSKFVKYEDVKRRIPDITKGRRLLGFKPRVSTKEGLIRTIEWQRKIIGK